MEPATDTHERPPEPSEQLGQAPPGPLPPGVHLCASAFPISADGAPAIIALIPTILLVLVAGSYVAWVALARVHGIPHEIGAAALTILTIAILWWVGKQAVRAYRRGVTLPPVPIRPDPSARVNIVIDAEHLAQLTPLRDDPFEPEIFRTFRADALLPSAPGRSQIPGSAVFRPTPPPARRDLIERSGGVWGFLPLMIFPALAFFPNTYTPHLFMGATFLVFTLYLFRRPTYLRIVPGRVDILRMPTLGFGTPHAESLDLREPVLVDVRTRQLVLRPVYERYPGDKASEPAKAEHAAKVARQRIVSFATTPRSEAAMLTIARAAVSTAEPPELPMDRLTW